VTPRRNGDAQAGTDVIGSRRAELRAERTARHTTDFENEKELPKRPTAEHSIPRRDCGNWHPKHRR